MVLRRLEQPYGLVDLIRAIKQSHLVKWPEPEGAPGVHDGLQPPVRGAGRGQVGDDLVARDRLLGPGRSFAPQTSIERLISRSEIRVAR